MAGDPVEACNRQRTRALRIKAPIRNNIVEDAIIIEDDGPLAAVKEEPVDAQPSSSSQSPRFRDGVRSAPHSDRIEGLNYLNTEIGCMEYGVELWKVVHHLIGRSSLEEFIQLPKVLGHTVARLTTFGVLEAYQLKGVMEELASMVEEILC
ncbi:hypothetical protein AMTR_s00087p00060950 [Amborella trichopoda]|uniref:Uncharacterized protein n=1 Tax=Amborella trichopoda TaxID=13333 RepID=W1P4Q4_AMBTC|nr:hypothetical protein AMTR_s00087p00060950 [Amborella trichopoda]